MASGIRIRSELAQPLRKGMTSENGMAVSGVKRLVSPRKERTSSQLDAAAVGRMSKSTHATRRPSRWSTLPGAVHPGRRQVQDHPVEARTPPDTVEE